MAYNWQQISDNIVNISQILNDFLDTKNPKNVKWVYVDNKGDVHEMEIPNFATVLQQLDRESVTEDELKQALSNYYTKAEIDKNVKNYILNIISNDKQELLSKIKDNENLINSKATELNNEIKAANDKINNNVKEIENAKKLKVMSKADYEALRKERINRYAGAGQVSQNGKFESLFANNSFGVNFLFHNRCYVNKEGKIVNDNLDLIPNQLAFPLDEGYFKDRRYIPRFVINGHLITLFGTGIGRQYLSRQHKPGSKSNYGIDFPKAPTAKAIVKDSKKLPVDLNQGDFVILKDLNRELVSNGTFDNGIEGWTLANTDNYHGKQEYDSENKRIKITVDNDVKLVRSFLPINLIKGVRYKLTFSIQDKTDNAEVEFKIGTGPGANNVFWKHYLDNGDYEFEFTANYGGELYITLEVDIAGQSAYYDNISIKQAKEQPLVALENVPANIDIYENTDKFEGRETISRKDLVFIETWEEDIAEKDVFYPYGNVQYQGQDVEGVPGIKIADWFEGYETYSRFGTWQEPGALIGVGYKWSELTEDQKITLASNPDHNVYKNGDKWIQVRYRVRVVKGLGDKCYNTDPLNGPYLAYLNNYKGAIISKGNKTKLDYDYNTTMIGGNSAFFLTPKKYPTFYNIDIKEFQDGVFVNRDDVGYNPSLPGTHVIALPLILVQRRNDGIFNKLFNPMGTARAYVKANSKLLEFGEYAIDDSFVTSLEDCFNLSNIAAVTEDENIVPADDNAAKYRSGYVFSKISGHEAGLFADEINERDIEDLRFRAKKYTKDEIYKKILSNLGSKKLRGENNLDKIEKVTLWLSSSPFTNKKDGGIYTFDYKGNYRVYLDNIGTIVLDGVMINNNYRKFYVEWIDANENVIGGEVITETSRCDQIHTNKKSGVVGLRVFVRKSLDSTYNYISRYTEILGDIRPLKVRVNVSVTSENKTLNELTKNTYVLCQDGTHNNGKVGHVYRYLGNTITKVATNDNSVGNANESNGHIDFSNSTLWLDLGNDLEAGKTPEIWENNGYPGFYSPEDDLGSTNYPYLKPISTYKPGDGVESLIFKLRRLSLGNAKVVAINTKTGEKRTLSVYETYYSEAFAGIDAGRNNLDVAIADNNTGAGISTTKNLVYINLTYTDSNGNQRIFIDKNELDFWVFIVSYDTFAEITKPIPLNSHSTTTGFMFNSVTICNYKRGDYAGIIANDLLNKVCTWGIAAPVVTSIKNKFLTTNIQGNDYYILKHEPFDRSINFSGNFAVKWINILSNVNNAAYLDFYFNEVKPTNPNNFDNPGNEDSLYIRGKVVTGKDSNGNYIKMGYKTFRTNFYFPIK